MVGFRASPALPASIVKWAENQPDMPSRSEDARRLVEIGLSVGKAKAAIGRRASMRASKVMDSLASDLKNAGDDGPGRFQSGLR